MSQSTIGLIGLGTMGAALARNLASRDILTSVFNRTYRRTKDLLENHPNSNLIGFEELTDFVHSLELPRKIILMVNAGGAVDNSIEQIFPLLDKGDTIIDCGNSNWRDTIKRQQDMQQMGINFIGCGVSGGEEGALLGPSIMPGGDAAAVNLVLPILERIAAKDFQGKACVTNVGLAGAGHFVKMVHNGIEYALMQGIAEIYDVLRHSGYNNSEVSSTFDMLNQDELKSFLLEITVQIFNNSDNLAQGDLIDKISSVAGAKGTGKWTVEAGMDLGIAIPNISSALFARIMSARTQNFPVFVTLEKIELKEKIEINQKMLFKCLRAIYYTSYLQGIDLILAANQEFNWSINILEVLRIWEGGCIIRSNMLRDLSLDFEKKPEFALKNNLIDFTLKLKVHHQALIAMFNHLSQQTFCLPLLSVFNSALDYCGALTMDNLPTNLIQAQRDYFGSHTYQRTDQEGIFTGGWERD